MQGALERLRNSRNGFDTGTATGIKSIRAYNSEIKRLEKNVSRLGRINGIRLKSMAGEAFK